MSSLNVGLFEACSSASRLLGDTALAWLLQLPRDAALLVLAGLTAGSLLLLRRLAARRETLRCLAADSRRLSELTGRARADRDRQRLRRYRRTRGRIARMRLAAEARLALLSLVPLALVVTWAAARLHYVPPAAGRWLEFTVYTPVSAVGEPIHLVPGPSLETANAWIREVELAEHHARPRGRARWSVRTHSTQTQLLVRLRSRTLEHPLLVGQIRYAPPVRSHGGQIESVVALQTYHPFGLLPGVPQLGLPPWLVGYVALVLICFYGVKRLTRMD